MIEHLRDNGERSIDYSINHATVMTSSQPRKESNSKANSEKEIQLETVRVIKENKLAREDPMRALLSTQFSRIPAPSPQRQPPHHHRPKTSEALLFHHRSHGLLYSRVRQP